jgi:hypothetical protein
VNRNGRPRIRKTACDINQILARNQVHSPYGARMGATNYDRRVSHARVYAQAVRIDSGGYAPCGTYWGLGLPLFAFFTADLSMLWYVRAKHRADAVRCYMLDNRTAHRFGQPWGGRNPDAAVLRQMLAPGMHCV